MLNSFFASWLLAILFQSTRALVDVLFCFLDLRAIELMLMVMDMAVWSV